MKVSDLPPFRTELLKSLALHLIAHHRVWSSGTENGPYAYQVLDPKAVLALCQANDEKDAEIERLKVEIEGLRAELAMSRTGAASRWELCAACNIYATDNRIDGVPICPKCESIGRRPPLLVSKDQQ